jgi:hypothetical protein
MRRLTAAFLFISLIALCACKRSPEKVLLRATTEETAPPLATVVHTADPQASAQLIAGFYDVEQNSWRWTRRKFAVNLRSPVDSNRNGATLVLKFVIPDPVIARLKTVTLSASVAGFALAPETYTASGSQTYSREVPGKALTTGAVKVEFALDKALPPGPSEQRELGVVANSIALEPK